MRRCHHGTAWLLRPCRVHATVTCRYVFAHLLSLQFVFPAHARKRDIHADRIFTRIGACDNIIAGRSTFMVELKETASILRHATAQSLVILDELGRGTSTHDGYAIAYAVLKHLAETTKCRGLFATHYHNLTEEFSRHEEVTNFHMACCVEPGRRDVVFLYKLQPGVCSKSYGMNVASMAGVPASVIEVAESKAEEFERESCRSRSTRARAFGRLYRMATTPSEFSSAKFNKLLD